MENNNNQQGTSEAPSDTPTFVLKEKLSALEGIIGHQRHERCFVQNHQAKYLGLDSAQWSRKVNGETRIRESELAKLIELFDLGPRLDYRLFFAPTLETFLGLLEAAGVGTYGGSFRTRLCNLLHSRARICRNRIRVISTRQTAQRGGIGRAVAKRPEPPILHYNEEVRVVCEGPIGRYLVLLNTSYSGGVTVLTPTEADPLQFTTTSIVTVPDSGAEPFKVQAESDDFYLYALWTDVDTARLFLHQGSGLSDDLSEEAARLIFSRVHPQREQVEAAAFNFTVSRP